MTAARAPPRASAAAPPRRACWLGVRFIRATPIILGAITLDLFAVLFGGAVALLPLFARSILHTGPFGLGMLRSATAVGALIGGDPCSRAGRSEAAPGRTLLLAVGVVRREHRRLRPLALVHRSRSLALAVSGFVDMFSMNIRSTTVALATPNELRGRVNAVEGVFIGASNELGAFESGAAAALLGAVPAVVAGGAITIALALVWGRLFPALARVDRLEDVRPDDLAAGPGEVLVVGRRRSSARPIASRPRRRRARARRPATAIPGRTRDRSRYARARRRNHAAAFEVRVLDVVDVDRLAVGVHRPALRARRHRAAAVEPRRVVCGGRAVVTAAVARDRPHAPDREARRRRARGRPSSTSPVTARLTTSAPRCARPSKPT